MNDNGWAIKNGLLNIFDFSLLYSDAEEKILLVKDFSFQALQNNAIFIILKSYYHFEIYDTDN